MSQEATWFEEPVAIKLLDGKTYKIAPMPLRKTRELGAKLQGVFVDRFSLNFLGNVEEQQKALDALKIIFPDFTDDDILDKFNSALASKAVGVAMEVDGLKK